MLEDDADLADALAWEPARSVPTGTVFMDAETVGAYLVRFEGERRAEIARRARSEGEPKTSRYFEAALEHAAEEMRAVLPGQRAITLNSLAWGLGKYVAVGALTEGDVLAELVPAATGAGLLRREAVAVVRGALRRRAAA